MARPVDPGFFAHPSTADQQTHPSPDDREAGIYGHADGDRIGVTILPNAVDLAIC